VAYLSELDRYLFGEGTHRRAYERLGAHERMEGGIDGTHFAVWAPNARRVSVVGDFCAWDGRKHPMTPLGDSGLHEVFVPGVKRGARYKFEIEASDGALLPLKTDPYAFRCEPPPGNASVVEAESTFVWTDDAWLASRRARQQPRAPIAIYEAHLGSFRRNEDGTSPTYRELAEMLVPYVASLGFTHVELLPVAEHPFYGSWGYQPMGLFAPTCRYGSPDDFRALVDAFHGAGIGVIVDWVPAHFPADPEGLGRFDGTCLYEHEDPRKGVHPDWNTLVYDYDRREVLSYLLSNALFWIERFHVDGLRVDAVASMLYLDYSRREGEWIPNVHGGRENLGAVDFLRRLNELVHAEHEGVLTIAEESTAWPMVSRPSYVGGLGFDYKWNMGWMHDTLRHFSRDPAHRAFHFDELTFSMLYHRSEKYVLPLSHDEVVHGKRSLLGRMPGSNEDKLANLRLLFAYQWAHGGKKLLFMGSELAQWSEWSHDAQLDWALLEHESHRGVSRLVADLNRIYVGEPALHESDVDDDGFRWIDCSDRAQNVLVILRETSHDERHVVVVLNFSGSTREEYRIGVPRTGTYREILNTDGAAYGGCNDGNSGAIATEAVTMHGHAQSLRLRLPRLSAIYLRSERPGESADA